MLINPNKFMFWFCLLLAMIGMSLGWWAIQIGQDAVDRALKTYDYIEKQIESRP